MGKKLDKLVARIQALEKAIAAMVTGKKPKKSAKKKSAQRKSKAKTAKAAPKKKKKTTAKKPAPKRRARKAKPVTPPLPLAATL
jgi:peptidoglycan hydrolase CwlO-like protein